MLYVFNSNGKILKLFVIISLSLIFGASKCQSQSITENSNKDSTVYLVVDEMPQYPGGDAALEEFIRKNFMLTERAMKKVLLQELLLLGF